tara:strand:+ start:29602 stop:29739 length:138 start_codon:yes stop_codon:yes gene_type:complete
MPRDQKFSNTLPDGVQLVSGSAMLVHFNSDGSLAQEPMVIHGNPK